MGLGAIGDWYPKLDVHSNSTFFLCISMETVEIAWTYSTLKARLYRNAFFSETVEFARLYCTF